MANKPVSMGTAYFNRHKTDGYVRKAGTARFLDGMREYSRVLWFDELQDRYFVIVNGNAYPFHAYRVQDEPGVIIGHI